MHSILNSLQAYNFSSKTTSEIDVTHRTALHLEGLEH